MKTKEQLTSERTAELIEILQKRFEKNRHRHPAFDWSKIHAKLEENSQKCWSLNEMEETGGEPDVIAYDEAKNEYHFVDCAKESPKGRRSLCYDQKALESRKEYKPKNSAVSMAEEMGVELLTEDQYRLLQQVESVDTKTSSWILTPTEVRTLGGAIFGDWRFGRVFVYHNGAESYYAARGFRGMLKV